MKLILMGVAIMGLWYGIAIYGIIRREIDDHRRWR